MKNALLFLVAFLGVALSFDTSRAYFIATEPARLKAGVPTDVYVAGFGDNQGNQFLKTAVLAAQVSRDRFPQRQRVVISALNGSLRAESAILTGAGLTIRKADDEDLTGKSMLRAFDFVGSNFSSLHFYGHANTYNGFRLQSRSDRLSHDDKEFAKIGAYLGRTAFVVFNSCNSGWFMATTGAQMWRRPVFGSLTGSNFQEPMSDGKWYFHDAGQYPSNLTRVGPTTQITRESLACTSGKCLRLKPGNRPYHDSFGDFESGLGFYRAFVSQEAAGLLPQALVHYTLLNPGATPLSLQSSRADFVSALIDWMCPTDKSGDRQSACAQAIRNKEFERDPHLNFFGGKALSCNYTTCGTVVKCNVLKAFFGIVPCRTEVISRAKSTDFSSQLKAAFQGLDQLEKGQLSF